MVLGHQYNICWLCSFLYVDSMVVDYLFNVCGQDDIMLCCSTWNARKCSSWFIRQKLSWSGSLFNIKMSSYQYRKSHCEDKTVVRSPYLHNGITCSGKISSLYWRFIRWLPGDVVVISKVNLHVCLKLIQRNSYLDIRSEIAFRPMLQNFKWEKSSLIGVGNCLVPPRNWTLAELMLIQIHVAIWRHYATMS